MRAFSVICKKVKISVFDNTFTMYIQPRAGVMNAIKYLDSTPPGVVKSLSLFIAKRNSLYPQVPRATRDFRDKLGASFGHTCFFNNDEVKHDKIHEDGFDMKDPHYHSEFLKPIDEEQLKKIIWVLFEHDALSEVEGKQIIAAYRKANVLPPVIEKATLDSISMRDVLRGLTGSDGERSMSSEILNQLK